MPSPHIGPYGLKLSVIPNGGGWRFPIPETHSENLEDKFFRADGFWKLCHQVRIFRIQAMLKVGAVEYEVAEFIKAVSPENSLHRGRSYEPPPEGQEDFRPLINRVGEWLVATGMKKNLRRVIKPDAEERAQVCLKCPHNIRWQTKCAPCNEEIVYRGQNLRATPLFEYDPKLNACRLHNILLLAACFLDPDELPAKQPDSPAECWLPLKP